MIRPWMKFYPADWRAEPRLRMCSLAARGLWIDLIAYMHEGEPYGHLTIDGIKPSIENIASLVASPKIDVIKALAELERCRVFSRTEGGAIYSRRMERDNLKAHQDSANGKAGGNPRLLQEVNQGVNPPDKAQRLEARSQRLEKKETRAGALAPGWPADYREQFWSAYPNKVGKADALQKLDKIARSGKVPFDTMSEALFRYANKTDDRPFCNPATWLHQERWTDQPAPNNGAKNGSSSPNRDLLKAADELVERARAEHAASCGEEPHGDRESAPFAWPVPQRRGG